MMGKKTLAEIRAELELSGSRANGKPRVNTRLRSSKLEKLLSKKLAELEREISANRKPRKVKQP
jgi:hypothetical protein